MGTLPTLYEYYTAGGITAGLNADLPYFTLNNKNITIYSGAMHYFRVPQEYWRDRLRKMRAAGLNTVETYVPWNLHEHQNGTFDFGSGGSDFQQLLDIETFLKTAQEEDLLAIVRPGPYICSEWEFGGMPSWLLREKDIRVRTSDEIFIGYMRKYFSALLSILTLLQFTLGGPIIGFQVENEYGYIKNTSGMIDMVYLETIRNTLRENGVVELLFTSDNPVIAGAGAIVPGVLATANFKDSAAGYLGILQQLQPGRPLMAMEYWTGWYDTWGSSHSIRPEIDFTSVLKAIVTFPASVNFYMFHGGTNFGFSNGANIDEVITTGQIYYPITSSYDYDAPLSEAGDYTDKYFSLQRVIAENNPIQTFLPPLPELIPRIAYPDVQITQMLTYSEFAQNIPIALQNSDLVPMEQLPINNNSGQSYGYIIYRRSNLNIAPGATLQIEGRVSDTVMVLINGQIISGGLDTPSDLNGFGFWCWENSTLYLGDVGYLSATLELVTENWGRNNFALDLNGFRQFKGLWQGNVLVNDEIISGWDIAPLEFKTSWIKGLTGWHEPTFGFGPALYKGVLNIANRNDTFIDLRNWNKGVVIVNGFVLSRYARIGPQQTAYLPAPFLVVGDNEIVIFEHFTPNDTIRFSSDPIYETISD